MSSVIANDWESHWKTYAESASENPAQNYRRELVFSALGLSAADRAVRVLDVGSGQGDFSVDLKTEFPRADLLGLELSQSGVEISQKKVPGARFLQQNLLEAKEPPAELRGWATHAVCAEMLEHVEDPGKVLRNIRPYLAQDCRLVITVPGGPMSAFDKHIGHYKHYRGAELRALLESNGYRVESVKQAGFPFMNLYRLVVILRGRALVRDVAAGESGKMSRLARFVMGVFSVLFRGNADHSRWGWQMVAVARPA